jgi:crotonobetainyl-CoA:carnitine CoA-transferase CaiB-like acyl-CoA transferase
MPAAVPKMSATPAPPLRAAPTLGQDTLDVLTKIAGMDDAGIAAMKAKGVV